MYPRSSAARLSILISFWFHFPSAIDRAVSICLSIRLFIGNFRDNGKRGRAVLKVIFLRKNERESNRTNNTYHVELLHQNVYLILRTHFRVCLRRLALIRIGREE